MAHHNSTPPSILNAPTLREPDYMLDEETGAEIKYVTNRALRRAAWKQAKTWQARLKQEAVPVHETTPEGDVVLDEDGEPVILRYKKVTHKVPRKRSGLVHGNKTPARIATHIAVKHPDGTTTVEELGPVPSGYPSAPFTGTLDGEPVEVTQI